MGPPTELVEERRPAVAVGSVLVGVTELVHHPGSTRRQERRGRQADEPAGLDEVSEHAVQSGPGPLVARLGRLCEDPGLLRVHDLVRAADVLPELRESLVEQAALELLAVGLERLVPSFGERRRGFWRGAGRRPSRYRAAIETVRFTRLPKSFARSAL
jgi:hypothetical protein